MELNRPIRGSQISSRALAAQELSYGRIQTIQIQDTSNNSLHHTPNK